ncbi:hypothetical protein AYO22_00906 [Fonsecaea multimorphosa]|nr:hypothetical protein AYO22_00906 [Fonsecaea multimorphosa]
MPYPTIAELVERSKETKKTHTPLLSSAERRAKGIKMSGTLVNIAVLDIIVGLDEIAVIHHTDCGASRYTDDSMRKQIKERAGPGCDKLVDELDPAAIGDLEGSIREDLAELRQSPLIRKELSENAQGFIFDVFTGELTRVEHNSQIPMFEFINSTPAQLSPSQATRVRIRKQAMKKVAAARRRRGTYGKHNLRQLPNFLHPTQSSSPEDQEHSQSKHLQMDRRGLRDLDPPSLLQADYSHLIVSAHFSILNICPLASLHLGLAKVSHFTSDPVHMRDIFIFPYGGNSLLSFVPSRYGQTPSLTYAADCVVERLRGIVDSNRVPSGGPTVASRYVKALKCLQAALDDRELCMKPETLCATELLGIFEVT